MLAASSPALAGSGPQSCSGRPAGAPGRASEQRAALSQSFPVSALRAGPHSTVSAACPSCRLESRRPNPSHPFPRAHVTRGQRAGSQWRTRQLVAVRLRELTALHTLGGSPDPRAPHGAARSELHRRRAPEAPGRVLRFLSARGGRCPCGDGSGHALSWRQRPRGVPPPSWPTSRGLIWGSPPGAVPSPPSVSRRLRPCLRTAGAGPVLSASDRGSGQSPSGPGRGGPRRGDLCR